MIRPASRVVPRLMLVTDRHRSLLPLPSLTDAVIAGGCDAIQVRETGASHDELRRLAVEIVEVVRGRCVVLINGDMHLAKSLGLGLHLPERGAGPDLARHVLGPRALIGRSVHGPDSSKDTVGVDYLVAGNVFATDSHPGRHGLGLTGLNAVVAATTLPVLAIGGIDAENAAGVIEAGASGVAVIGAVATAPSAEEAQRRAAEIRRVIDGALLIRQGVATMQTNTEAARLHGIATVEVNGKPTTLPAATTVSAFLAEKGLQDRLVVVELNGRILPRAAYGETDIADGDRLEVVHFVGGG